MTGEEICPPDAWRRHKARSRESEGTLPERLFGGRWQAVQTDFAGTSSLWGALHLRDITADMIGARPVWLLLEKRLEFGECLALPVLLLVGLPRNVVDNGWMLIGQCMRLLSAGDGSIEMSLHVLGVS